MPSFEEIFGLANQLKHIEDLKLHLRTIFNGALLTALYFENESDEKERKNDFFNRNKEMTEKVNGEIKRFNLQLKEKYSFLPSKSLEMVNLDKVKDIIYEHHGKDSTSRKHTILKLNNCLLDSDNSVRNFLDSFEIQLKPFFGRKLPDVGGKENYELIKEAFDVYSIGYFGTSVLLMGKCLEKNITDLLKKNVDKNRIKYSLEEINKWSLDNKINILKKEFLISDGDYSKLKSIKWDRNIAGHPSSKEEMEKLERESSGTITICISQIIDLQNKIKEVKSEAEIEEEKARKILGGKSDWGGPILYGSPKEKLEQLKGYSGKMIDEIREQLKKELEEEKKKL